MTLGPVPNPSFDDRDYGLGCPACGWIVPPCPPWDEGLKRPAFCANCGLDLVRLACASCGAPAATEQTPSPRGWVTVFAARCVHCGERVVPKEPQMREKPDDGRDGLGRPRPSIRRT